MENPNLEELLKTCEDEKLHLSGLIQPFGSLVVVNEETFIITHVAENINEFLEFSADELLGKRIKELLPNWIDLFKLLDDETLKYPYIYQKMKNENIYLKISKVDDSFVIDIQKVKLNIEEKNLKKDQHKIFMTPDSEEQYDFYLENYMNIVFNTISYDRVMLYQYQDDFSGKVISERTSSDSIGSYLNLMFPASDIPKIARDLYMINPSRIIDDSDATNIDILSINDTIPDLTYSDTRSVSPLHIEYLKNMGVKSSFSIPIIIGNELWGLLGCHNFTKKSIDPIAKDIAIEQTKIFSLGVQNYNAKQKLNYIDNIQFKINDIIKSIIHSSDIESQILQKQENILELLQGDGCIFVIKEKVIAFGNLPDTDSFMEIDEIFLNSEKLTISSNSISNELCTNNIYLGPAGVFGVKGKFNDSIIIRCYWFRNEIIEELHWAGNPNKPVIEDAGAIRLSPRRSFEKFIEIKKGYSKKFDNLDVSTALKFSNSFFKYLIGEKS